MADNFICKDSGDTFYFSQFTTVISERGAVYKDKYKKEILHPKTGNRLEIIPKEGFPSFMVSEKERLIKTQAHFKARAKKHANSEEARGIKQQVKDREMDNMGFDKVKKKKK